MEEHLELIIEGRHRETALGPKEDLVEVQKLWNELGWD